MRLPPHRQPRTSSSCAHHRLGATLLQRYGCKFSRSPWCAATCHHVQHRCIAVAGAQSVLAQPVQLSSFRPLFTGMLEINLQCSESFIARYKRRSLTCSSADSSSRQHRSGTLQRYGLPPILAATLAWRVFGCYDDPHPSSLNNCC